MKTRLDESIYQNEDYIAPLKEMLNKGIKLYKDEEYAELGVLLGFLKALQMIHHSHHWQSLGDSFYGDHLLLQRLYEGIDVEVDDLGEKTVGVGGIKMTNYFALIHHMKSFMEGVSQGEDLTKESHRAELMFILAGEIVMSRLDSKGILTRGIEQAIGNILDKHEKNLYLLQQRTNL